jgi:hypothetical protein
MFGISAFAETPFASLAGYTLSISITGVQADGAVGSVTEVSSAGLNGAQAAGEVGSVVFGKDVTLDGAAAFGQTGSVSAGDRPLEITGVSASGSVESVGPVVAPEISGVLLYGEPGGVSEEPNITIAGVYAIGEIGSVIFTKEIAINGVAGAGAVGSVGGASDRAVELSGVTASGVLGTFGVYHENEIISSGGWGTGTWGQAEWGVGVGYPPPTSAQVGSVSPGNAQNITGLQANGYVGTFGVIHINGLLSVLARGYAGNVSNYFWTTIDDNQDPNWHNIDNE